MGPGTGGPTCLSNSTFLSTLEIHTLNSLHDGYGFPYYQTALTVGDDGVSVDLDCPDWDYIDEDGNKCKDDWPSLDELDF